MAAQSDFNWRSIHKEDLKHFDEADRFFNALQIWLERPQVLNRRLSGCHVLRSFKIAENTEYFLKAVYDFAHRTQHFSVEELYKYDVITNDGCQTSIGNAMEVKIRQLLPRQSDKHKNVTEIVIQDKVEQSVMFLPFENDTEDKIKSKIDQAYKVSLISQTNSEGLSLSILNTNEENRNGITCPTIEWLKTHFLPKLCKWMQDDASMTTGFGKSLRLVSVDKYTKRYEELKIKYKHFVKLWPERTDPYKFVYEDVAIATYLLLLWEEEDGEKLQTFVDLGCGNGLLVHILTNEGHIGKGIDLRSRKVWEFFGKVDLQVTSLDPSTLAYPNTDWIIGNHCDELTPWIPVIATRSSQTCKYFVLPCCFYEFYNKFQRGSAQNSQYRSYLDYIHTVGTKCGFRVQEDVLRIPSTKKVCQIGKQRLDHPGFMEDQITNLVRKTSRQLLTEDDQPCCQLDKDNPDLIVADGFPTSDTVDTSCENSKEQISFVPRSNKETVKNCTQLDKHLIDNIIQKVATELLSKTEVHNTTYTNTTKVWNKGGSIPLSEVPQMFDKAVLEQLRCEAGGIKTVLRNCHQVFKVCDGKVEIRDWTTKTDGSQKHKPTNTDKYYKTKPCWFYNHHPDGCPLTDNQCTFAHGSHNLKSPPPKM